MDSKKDSESLPEKKLETNELSDEENSLNLFYFGTPAYLFFVYQWDRFLGKSIALHIIFFVVTLGFFFSSLIATFSLQKKIEAGEKFILFNRICIGIVYSIYSPIYFLWDLLTSKFVKYTFIGLISIGVLYLVISGLSSFIVATPLWALIIIFLLLFKK